MKVTSITNSSDYYNMAFSFKCFFSTYNPHYGRPTDSISVHEWHMNAVPRLLTSLEQDNNNNITLITP